MLKSVFAGLCHGFDNLLPVLPILSTCLLESLLSGLERHSHGVGFLERVNPALWCCYPLVCKVLLALFGVPEVRNVEKPGEHAGNDKGLIDLVEEYFPEKLRVLDVGLLVLNDPLTRR